MKFKKKIKIAIDSPAAAGAGTQAKLISKHYNLFFLDTGKIYRLLGFYKIKNPKKFNYSYIKRKIKNLKMNDLQKKNLLSNKVGMAASIIAKDKQIRILYLLICRVHQIFKLGAHIIHQKNIMDLA